MDLQSAKLPAVAAPTRARKRLGAELRRLREDAGGITAAQAGAEAKTTDSTINRYEAGAVMPAWGVVLTLAKFYGATDDEIRELERLFDLAREEPPAVRLPADVPLSFRRLVNAERDAKRVRVVAPYVVPGLTQTEQYARALVNAAYRFRDPAARLEGVVARRANRQKRLEGSNPLELHALIDQAAIMRVVGGREVMCDQLGHLLTMADRSNIILQVVPYNVGAYGTMSGGCSIIDYPEPDEPSAVYLEYPAGGNWVDNGDDVSRFTAMFDDVMALALSPTDTYAMIQHQRRALESGE
jgi:transcriptional regulator with XRE-family HTH domain